MENDVYLKDGVGHVLELMKETFGDTFSYFDDELIDIPEASLPCIMVTETNGTVDSVTTATDRLVEQVTIIIVLNKKDDIGADENSELTGFKLRKMVKGQDPTTSYPYEYLPQTVMYAIRRHISMDESVIQNSVQTEFGPNLRGNNLATQEAHVTVTVTRQALIPQRD